MVAAHTELHDDLTGLAYRKMITLPTSMIENSQEAYLFLSSISVADFDKTYADKMVRGHENAVAAFEKASENSRDTDIKNWATASLPSLRKHLDLAKECQKKCTNK
jgi:putative membrane protein